LKHLRIIDANINRLREGLRVVEDILRYYFDDNELIVFAKELRHSLAKLDDATFKTRITARDSLSDAGFSNTGANESKRDDIKSLLRANLLRASEASRVLEEVLKTDDEFTDFSFDAKEMRYKIYHLEKLIFTRFKEAFN
jgi:thiamine-phosphate pyrophosphorylase